MRSRSLRKFFPPNRFRSSSLCDFGFPQEPFRRPPLMRRMQKNFFTHNADVRLVAPIESALKMSPNVLTANRFTRLSSLLLSTSCLFTNKSSRSAGAPIVGLLENTLRARSCRGRAGGAAYAGADEDDSAVPPTALRVIKNLLFLSLCKHAEGKNHRYTVGGMVPRLM